MHLNINSDAVVAHTNTLEKMHRSALPSAIRGTLNDLARDVKTNTMPKSATAEFVNRDKNFFKANSRYEKAVGFSVNSMVSTVGFIEGSLRGGNNFAVRDLEEQEHGGEIGGKSFIPTNESRSGKSPSKLVRTNARLSKIKSIANRRDANGKGWAQKMIKSAVHVGIGGFVLSESVGKGGALFRIKSIKRISGNTRFTAEKLYTFKKGRSIQVKPTHFMRTASLQSIDKGNDFFIKQATKQIERLRKR